MRFTWNGYEIYFKLLWDSLRRTPLQYFTPFPLSPLPNFQLHLVAQLGNGRSHLINVRLQRLHGIGLLFTDGLVAGQLGITPALLGGLLLGLRMVVEKNGGWGDGDVEAPGREHELMSNPHGSCKSTFATTNGINTHKQQDMTKTKPFDLRFCDLQQ